MGWEERNNRRYYYCKHWQNGTCVSKYMGSGSLAEVIDNLTQLERERQQLEREKWQQEKAEIKAIERQIDVNYLPKYG
ncbi:MAG: hypothetical protein JW953_08990 [Anaerolineae bacterium]|nr:hypothetical protein [Anaerolineae bacterium]